MESQEGHNPALEWRGKSASIPYGIRTELIAAAISQLKPSGIRTVSVRIPFYLTLQYFMDASKPRQSIYIYSLHDNTHTHTHAHTLNTLVKQ